MDQLSDSVPLGGGYHHQLRPGKMLPTKGKKQANIDLNTVEVADIEFVNVCSLFHRGTLKLIAHETMSVRNTS